MGIQQADREYLDRKYANPRFAAETGWSRETMRAELQRLFEQSRGLPRVTWKARAVECVLDHTRIDVSPHDWFIGCEAWLQKDIEAVAVWKWYGEVCQAMPQALRERQEAFSKSGLTMFCVDYAHSVPDWEAILRLGFTGLRQRLASYIAMFEDTGRATAETRCRFAAIDCALSAAIRFVDRLVKLAERQVAAGGGRRSELTLTCLKHLRDGHATTTYEALQQIWLYHLISESIDCLQTRSLGNLDRLLWPYYERDMALGTFTQDEIREMLSYFMYQQTIPHYKWGHPFYLGGTYETGESVINDLSYMIIEEYDAMGIYDPKIQIKVAKNTPSAFLDRVLTMIRGGHSSIVFVGEPCIERTMLRSGYTLEEARNAVVKGCYEYTGNGISVETNPVRINCASVVSLVLGNGIELHSGIDTGVRTGELDCFTSFEQFCAACETQLRRLCELSCEVGDAIEAHLGDMNPTLFFTAASAVALENGKDGYAFGMKHNLSNIWMQFPATMADSILAVKRFVFEKQQLTLQQLKDALLHDWAGYEHIREAILADKVKYGNNLPEADVLTKRLWEGFAKAFIGRPNARGGSYTVALHAASDFTGYRQRVGATADGRCRGDELSKNATPGSGRNWAGATAAIQSLTKLDSSLFAADSPLDLMLHPSAVQGDDGLLVFRSLIMTYIAKYGHAVHFNIFNADMLRDAQAHPEKYRDLQVRICGWNVLWNNLSKHEQDNYILQAGS